jgi:hypothetical protein
MKINRPSSHPATPIAIDDTDLAPVDGGIWGGPDGTESCFRGGPLVLRPRARGETPALPPTVVTA